MSDGDGAVVRPVVRADVREGIVQGWGGGVSGVHVIRKRDFERALRCAFFQKDGHVTT